VLEVAQKVSAGYAMCSLTRPSIFSKNDKKEQKEQNVMTSFPKPIAWAAAAARIAWVTVGALEFH